MKRERAEVIALGALGWLAANDELWPVFLGSTGAAAEDLRNRAAEPSFQASVLEFLTMDDAWVTSFCDGAGYDYDEPHTAMLVLAGPSRMNWT
ncbi:uncharacterized protein DUF3572 [Limimaricola soesokkakensis]|uniref:Uncharacterized protein DUF3572 n=1 Tax=Limimaricola soesokkakensis TaxID=1343159 RepID=A0A1X6Y7A3_9RHOB|nr:DUF3572 domain-containing protein [Limimaricola soesokkakensis]PSK87286.1 uncharacterized protein DUF3572 [Limimaricola soesokkakensis]SLN12664.1 hypothetical protein LOS8367_00061 [Limimaricola soesokkakensis]